MNDEQEGSGGESSIVVILALAANLGVGLLKLVAGLISGSGALLSEAAHSAGDTTTEVLLLVAQRRSRKPADRRHPFGYGKERYFWSLLAAGAIFVSGAAFSVWEGLHTILGPAESTHLIWINYAVLAGAAVLEGISFVNALRAVGEQRRTRRWSFADYVQQNDDPTENSVALEDSAALVGLALAAAGVALHQLTGNAAWDGVASLAIGVLLLVVAFLLARTCKDLLIGQQADPRMLRAIAETLREQDEVDDVVDLLSMLTGTDQVLLCVRADFVDSLSAADLEQACVRVADTLREQYPDLDEIFIQPAARTDDRVTERVRSRYGRTLTR
ncbi:MAG: cation diffusion facilitator family transporter [Jatrophihabitans sp.]|uniref:cation diffusion facilitator family transporter n=1 Tax=Jatrophihabitans sp. TaxID=1932789 RepID=UPI003F817FFF